jgi:phenylacetic acid degradation operon negative regulatory protein
MTLHFGEIREGVWGRPDNLDPARLPRQQAVLSAQCLRFRRALAPDDRGLAGRLFDLDGWAARAAVLRAAVACGPTFTDMAAPEDLVAGFVVSTAVLRHLQADPLLPDELLPADWPGEPLRREFAHRDEAFMRRLRAWMAAAG